jgi:hypothetical protein
MDLNKAIDKVFKKTGSIQTSSSGMRLFATHSWKSSGISLDLKEIRFL